MSQRLSRKEIKQDIREDEVQSFLITAIEKFQERPKVYIGGLVAFIVIGLGASGLAAYLDFRADKASEELSEAIRLYSAEVDATSPNPDADPPVFPSEEARRAKAEEVFSEIDAGDAGEVAKLYEARIALDNGDTDKAREIWNDFLAKNPDHVLAVSVRLNLFELQRKAGEAEQVAETLQGQLEAVEKDLPADVLIYELAQTREALGQSDAARELYQRLVDEYPQSPYTADARKRVAQG